MLDVSGDVVRVQEFLEADRAFVVAFARVGFHVASHFRSVHRFEAADLMEVMVSAKLAMKIAETHLANDVPLVQMIHQVLSKSFVP
jgi:hypothetical protein